MRRRRRTRKETYTPTKLNEIRKLSNTHTTVHMLFYGGGTDRHGTRQRGVYTYRLTRFFAFSLAHPVSFVHQCSSMPPSRKQRTLHACSVYTCSRHSHAGTRRTHRSREERSIDATALSEPLCTRRVVVCRLVCSSLGLLLSLSLASCVYGFYLRLRLFLLYASGFSCALALSYLAGVKKAIFWCAPRECLGGKELKRRGFRRILFRVYSGSTKY